MIAEITVVKMNEACADKAGDNVVDGKIIRTCYQGDYLNMLPTYVVTAIAFLEWYDNKNTSLPCP